MRTTLIAIVMVAVIAGCGRQKTETAAAGAGASGDAAGRAVANAALQVSELDARALAGINEKLEGACARNRFGLTEQACIQTIRTRKDLCVQQTAQKYPGQLANVDRMQEVASSYVNCLFQQ